MKQRVQIITVDPTTRSFEFLLNAVPVSGQIWEVPSFFRWPKQGEFWTVHRSAETGGYWVLGERMEDGNTGFPVEGLGEGEAKVNATRLIRTDDGARLAVVVGEPTDGQSVQWSATDNAWIPALTGSVDESVARIPLGGKQFRDTFGTYDQATVLSLIGNRSSDPTTQVLATSDVSVVEERSSVTAYIDNTAKPPTVDSTSTTFTASTVTFGISDDLSKVQAGMIIDIAGNEHVGGETGVGIVASVGGQTITLTSAGWHVGGSPSATPSNGTRARVNRMNKAWGLNVNVRSTNAEHSVLDGTSLTGIEVGVETDYDHGVTGFNGPTGLHAFGVDVWRNTNYSGRGLMGYALRGGFLYGFGSSGVTTGGAHFIAHDNYEYVGANADAAFYDDDSQSITAFKARKGNATDHVFEGWVGSETGPRFFITADGTITGSNGLAYTPLSMDGASVSLKVGGNTVLGVDSTGISFFGGPTVAKPTGVAVTAAGIHAALVSLNLIAP